MKYHIEIAKTPNRLSWRLLAGSILLAGGIVVAGCNTQQIITHGAIINQNQIDLVPIGSSKDQVLLALGTPSTVGTFDNEVYYYISQKRRKRYEYSKGQIVDQRVFAVYFDQESIVSNVADYGVQDGKVFDFISRTTPTGGRDYTFLGQLLRPADGKLPPINPLGSGTGGPVGPLGGQKF